MKFAHCENTTGVKNVKTSFKVFGKHLRDLDCKTVKVRKVLEASSIFVDLKSVVT